MKRLLMLIGVFASQPLAESRAADPLEAAVDQLVASYGVTDQTPGVAILVRTPDRVVFQKGYGLADIKNREPITPRTMFELASVCKSFTATAILILQAEGKLSVEDEVRKHVPELPEYRKGRAIRIRDLLQHVSGLPEYMSFENVPARHKDYWVNEDYAGEFARQRAAFPLSFPPGQRYEYVNSNYMLLGLIIERVSKKSFGSFLREAVFVPAGMQNSFVYESPQSVPPRLAGCNRALGYNWRARRQEWVDAWGLPPARRETLLTVGDGGIWSNLEDMARWDAAVRSNKLISAALMKQALASSKTQDGESNAYGFGWSIYPGESGELNGFGHDGSWGGFRTSYYNYLAAGRTTVVLSNRGNFDTDKFWYALDALIEKHAAR